MMFLEQGAAVAEAVGQAPALSPEKIVAYIALAITGMKGADHFVPWVLRRATNGRGRVRGSSDLDRDGAELVGVLRGIAEDLKDSGRQLGKIAGKLELLQLKMDELIDHARNR